MLFCVCTIDWMFWLWFSSLKTQASQLLLLLLTTEATHLVTAQIGPFVGACALRACVMLAGRGMCQVVLLKTCGIATPGWLVRARTSTAALHQNISGEGHSSKFPLAIHGTATCRSCPGVQRSVSFLGKQQAARFICTSLSKLNQTAGQGSASSKSNFLNKGVWEILLGWFSPLWATRLPSHLHRGKI